MAHEQPQTKDRLGQDVQDRKDEDLSINVGLASKRGNTPDSAKASVIRNIQKKKKGDKKHTHIGYAAHSDSEYTANPPHSLVTRAPLADTVLLPCTPTCQTTNR